MSRTFVDKSWRETHNNLSVLRGPINYLGSCTFSGFGGFLRIFSVSFEILC